MSFERILNKIRSNKTNATVVYIKGGRVRASHENHQFAKAAFMNEATYKVVGVYTYDVPSVMLAEDLELFGIY